MKSLLPQVEYEIANLFCRQIKSHLVMYDETPNRPWEWIFQTCKTIIASITNSNDNQ